jgi:hypothetical protein
MTRKVAAAAYLLGLPSPSSGQRRYLKATCRKISSKAFYR